MSFKATPFYKCRLCGEKFTNHFPSTVFGDKNSKEGHWDYVEEVIARIVAKSLISPTWENPNGPKVEVYCHQCEEGHMGLGDFIGFKDIEEDET